MPASLAKLEPSTRMAVFFIDDESDLVTLPGITHAGTGDLSTVSGIAQGSVARLINTDSTYYRIRSDETWIKITTGGGGGGGVKLLWEGTVPASSYVDISDIDVCEFYIFVYGGTYTVNKEGHYDS